MLCLFWWEDLVGPGNEVTHLGRRRQACLLCDLWPSPRLPLDHTVCLYCGGEPESNLGLCEFVSKSRRRGIKDIFGAVRHRDGGRLFKQLPQITIHRWWQPEPRLHRAPRLSELNHTRDPLGTPIVRAEPCSCSSFTETRMCE